MSQQLSARALLLVFSFFLLLPSLRAAEQVSDSNVARLKPTPDAGRIAFVTAKVLERHHYSGETFDGELSAKFFQSYVNALDPRHMHFLQSDLAEFERYRTNLNRLTIARQDTTPAYEIFARYLQRLEQHVAYVNEVLKTEKFEFTADEEIVVNRRELPFPQDMAEAKKIWHQWLRYEYLSEKLAREAGKKTTAGMTTSNQTASASTNLAVLKTIPEQITETLTNSYHRNLKLFREWDSDDVLDIYLNALAHAYDPHSDYQAPMQNEDFTIMMNLSLFGIGAVLRSDEGFCKIQELLDGPAMKSKKIKVGDRIIAVAQGDQPPVNIKDMQLNKAVRLIRGPKGTQVRLTILPVGETDEKATKEVVLIRDEIKLENSEAKASIIDLPNDKGGTVRMGVVDLPSFYGTIDARGHAEPKSTTADVAKLLKKFREEKVEGVILDLRRNGGGLLEEAVRLTGLFIKDGPVVQVREASGFLNIKEDTDSSVVYDGPLIVMTSRFSASASEIVAGALQDYGRAVIVGDVSTFGKGTAQSLYPLRMVIRQEDMTNDPGTLKITNSKFYRASGASTELKGVNPDIVLPSIWNHSTDIGERMLDNHLPWDTIETAQFEKVDFVRPHLAELMKRSSERIATNKDFVYLREDIEQFQKLWTTKTVSLNEKQRLKEKQDDEARKKARDEERKTRPEPNEKVYELTVKLAGQAGLPSPVQKTNSVASAEGAAGTNSLAAAESPEEEVSTSEEDWWRKAALRETQRIMMDYIQLLPRKDPTLVVTPAARSSQPVQSAE